MVEFQAERGKPGGSKEIRAWAPHELQQIQNYWTSSELENGLTISKFLWPVFMFVAHVYSGWSKVLFAIVAYLLITSLDLHA